MKMFLPNIIFSRIALMACIAIGLLGLSAERSQGATVHQIDNSKLLDRVSRSPSRTPPLRPARRSVAGRVTSGLPPFGRPVNARGAKTFICDTLPEENASSEPLHYRPANDVGFSSGIKCDHHVHHTCRTPHLYRLRPPSLDGA